MKPKLILNSIAILTMLTSTAFAKNPVSVSCSIYLKQTTTIEISYNREFTFQDGVLKETKDPGNYSVRFTPKEMKVVKEGYANVARPNFTNIKSPGLLLAPIVFAYKYPEQHGFNSGFEILFHSDAKPANASVSMITPSGQSDAVIDKFEQGQVANTYKVEAHWDNAPADLLKGPYAVGLLVDQVLVDRFVFDISDSGYAALVYLEQLKILGAKSLSVIKKTGKLKGLPECFVPDENQWG